MPFSSDRIASSDAFISHPIHSRSIVKSGLLMYLVSRRRAAAGTPHHPAPRLAFLIQNNFNREELKIDVRCGHAFAATVDASHILLRPGLTKMPLPSNLPSSFHSMDPFIAHRVWTSTSASEPSTSSAPPLFSFTPPLAPVTPLLASLAPTLLSDGLPGHRPFGMDFEAYMTLVTCVLILVVWVGGVALWYLYCIRRPPRLYLGK